MSWPIVNLGDVCQKVDYGLTASAAERVDGPRFLRITDMQDDTVDWDTVPSCECSDREYDQNKLAVGDIVFARTGATTGKSFLIRHLSKPAVFASYLIRVRPSQSLDPVYLSYFLKSSMYWHQISTMASGAAQPGVNSSKLKELSLPLPPLPEQKRIAAILDKADAIRRKRQQAIQLADDFLRAVFTDMFGDPVANTKGFPMGTVRDLVATANYGSSAKASESEGEYPILRMGNITYQGGIDLKDLKYIDLDEVDKPKYLICKGDLLFNRTNSKDLVGKTAVYDRDESVAIAGYLVRIRPNELGNSYYISGYLNSVHGKTTLRAISKSIVGMANINAQEIQDVSILIPPIALQKKYQEIVVETKKRVARLESGCKLNLHLFGSISQQAFSGAL